MGAAAAKSRSELIRIQVNPSRIWTALRQGHRQQNPGVCLIYKHLDAISGQIQTAQFEMAWPGAKGAALGFRANESALRIEVYRSEPSEGTDPDPALLPETRRAALSAAQKHLNFLD
jgi:hypothetical protein